MVIKSLYYSLVAIGLSVACADAPTEPMRPTAPQFEEGQTCPEMVDEYDPDCPDSPVALPDTIFTYHVAEPHESMIAPSDMPVWEGETPLNVPVSRYECPPILVRGQVFGYQGRRWWAPGPLIYTGPTQSPGDYAGIPAGNYETARGQILSMDGRYELVGGVKIVCEGAFLALSRFVFPVWVGQTHPFGGYGTVRRTSGGTGGIEGSAQWDVGWSWGGPTVQVENGVPDGWREVLTKFLTGGGCTKGWEIWVDGEMRCNADGELLD